MRPSHTCALPVVCPLSAAPLHSRTAMLTPGSKGARLVSLPPATPVSSLFPILKGRRECGAAWPSVLWGSLGVQAAGGEPWAPGCQGSAVSPLPPTQSAPLLHCSASGSSTLLSLGVCSRVSSSGHTLSSPKLLGESCLLWSLNLSSCRECLSLSHCPSRHVPFHPAWTPASPVCRLSPWWTGPLWAGLSDQWCREGGPGHRDPAHTAEHMATSLPASTTTTQL